jgi:hypothetical protein
MAKVLAHDRPEQVSHGPALVRLGVQRPTETNFRFAYCQNPGIGAVWFMLGAAFVGRVQQPEQALAA